VASESAHEASTINEIATEHDLHSVMVGQWKNDLLEGASERMIGQLTMKGERAR
jgi:hypothetical protein